MNSAIIVLGMAGVVIVARWLMELGLAQLNRRHVLAHADEVPDAFKDMMDQATYARSVQYTLAKGRFGQIEDSWRMIVLLVVLFSGVLPWGFGAWNGWLGDSAWTAAAFLFVVGLLLSLTELPFDWYLDFRLEQRFGFNTMTPRVWWADRVKGLLLASLLGYPLLALMLKFVEWTGAAWWLWAWAALLGFQLVLSVLAPVLILPLFNKFTPLPEGELRERLTALHVSLGQAF